MFEVTKRDLLRFMEGHAKTNERIREEKRKILSQLTQDISLRESKTLR